MDTDTAIREVQKNIGAGNLPVAIAQMKEIIAGENDSFKLLTCASLLKALGYNNEHKSAVEKIMSNLPTGNDNKLNVAVGLKNLGDYLESMKILETVDPNDEALRNLADACHNVSSNERALECLEGIQVPMDSDDILKVAVYSSLKRYDDSDALSLDLLMTCPDDFDVARCRCSALIYAGRNKDAESFVRAFRKSHKGSADAEALAAFFMWASGKIGPAGGFATKAIQKDNTHIGAMEVLAHCLVSKGEKDRAKIVAGAINEQSPGHPTVFRIIDLCSE